MLLVEVSINNTVHRIGIEDVALEHLWRSFVVDFSEFQIKLEETYGGYARPSYGYIVFSPELFESDWPPPVSLEITVKHTTTTEVEAVSIFTGIAHLKEIDRDGVTYRLYQPDYDTSVDGQVFNDTLINVVLWACDSARLNLTLNSSGARTPSPRVLHTTKDVILVDEISKICAFYSHYFAISGSTLTLVDALSMGTPKDLTEFDFFTVEYEYPEPYSKINSGDYSVDGSHAYGKKRSVSAYHTTQSNIVTALADIKTMIEYPEVVVKMPISHGPVIGEFMDVQDETGKLVSTISIHELNYDFNTDTVTARAIAKNIT